MLGPGHFEGRHVGHLAGRIGRVAQLGSAAGGEIVQSERPLIGEEAGIGQDQFFFFGAGAGCGVSASICGVGKSTVGRALSISATISLVRFILSSNSTTWPRGRMTLALWAWAALAVASTIACCTLAMAVL